MGPAHRLPTGSVRDPTDPLVPTYLYPSIDGRWIQLLNTYPRDRGDRTDRTGWPTLIDPLRGLTAASANFVELPGDSAAKSTGLSDDLAQRLSPTGSPMVSAAAERVTVDARAVLLVEGVSDQLAVQALAERYDRDLHADGVSVLPMGGATNIGHFLGRFGPAGLGLELAGLCDEAEVPFFRRALGRAGLGDELTRQGMAIRGFHVCVSDLEDELIRALGVPAVEQILDQQGDLNSFRLFQRQPAQRARPDEARLRRFLGTRGGRKIHYAPLLVHALDLTRVPTPLRNLLVHVPPRPGSRTRANRSPRIAD